jgi:uncharacterized protein YbjT (DUF2867 family)
MAQPAEQKIYTVIGATSDVGKVVVDGLRASGHGVRPVSRSHGISLDDARALRQAFTAVEGAFILIPFDMQAEDLHDREREMGGRLAEAMKGAGLRRVVLLSGLSAHLRTGSSLGAALMEDRLDRLEIPELVHLRAGFFMENFLKGLAFPAQVDTGAFMTPFRGDRPMPMISAGDVGVKAAEALTEMPFRGSRVRELHGAGDYTLTEATATLCAALGRPEVPYVQVPYQDARAGMMAAGMSASFAEAVLETARSFNEGEVWALETRSERHTTPTSLESWAKRALIEETFI